jgi:heme exporter protein D
MIDLGPHAAFIVGAYAATVIVLAGLIAWIVVDARTQNRLLAELEAQGVIRRSAKKKGTGKSGAGRK